MLGYKGFKKNMRCHWDIQYEVGQTLRMSSSEIKLFENGFHFNQHAIDVLKFYDENDLYALIEASGEIIIDDYMSVCSEIKILKMIDNEQLKKSMNGMIVRHNGTQEWYKNGQLHAVNFAAKFFLDGTEEWWCNGELHNSNGPAIRHSDGSQEWWLQGKLHRLDGPAIELVDGTMKWYIHGNLHRELGPAKIECDGTLEWWYQNQLHRKNGPAIIKPNRQYEWWFRGKLHRNDGPAVIFPNGSLEWWIFGEKLGFSPH